MPSIMRLDSSAWTAQAASNIGRANARLSSSVGRLSSGERFVRAGDDVAGLSIAAKMAAHVAAMKTARLNMAQATSLLQVMDGGLQNIQDAVLRMDALSLQASSGTLTGAERGFLNQEFQQLYKEVNRIANQTQFGGIPLLNATASAEKIYVNPVALDDSAADSYSAMLVFNSNWTVNNATINLGTFDTAPDERFYWRNNTALGNPAFNFQNTNSLHTKLQNMVTAWNNPNGAIQQDERFSGVTMELMDNMVKVTARSRGALSQLFAIGDLSSSVTVRNAMDVLGEDFQRNATSSIFNYVLQADGNGSATGLQMGSTVGYGSTGGALIADQSQAPAEVRLRMTGNFINGQQLRIDDGQNGLLNFTFRNTAVSPFLDIQIGNSITATIDNAVAFLNNFVEYNQNNPGYSTWYSMAHLEFSRDGNDLVIRHKLPGKPVDLFGNDYNFRDTLTNGTINNGVASGANLNMVGGTNTGIDAAGVINKDFTGTIQGFEATFVGADKANVSVQVGDATYTARILNTNLQAATRVRFFSDEHGYFDVDLQAGRGMPVKNQNDANAYAKQFDAAFSDVTFYQQRTMTNFEPQPPSPLVGAMIEMKREDFSTPLLIEDFKVTAAQQNAGSARISMTIGGETFISTQRIDRGIRPTAEIVLRSMADANRTVTFSNFTTNTFDLTTADDASRFEDEMRKYLPFGSIRQNDSGILSFQADSNSSNVLNVKTVDATAAALFGKDPVSVATVDAAQSASRLIKEAMRTLTGLRAEVGASQQQSDIAMRTLEDHLRNETEAHARLADVDVAAESTTVALEYVKLNAGIMVTTQTTQLHTDMVRKVIEESSTGA